MKTYKELMDAFHKKKKLGKKIAITGYVLLGIAALILSYDIGALFFSKHTSNLFFAITLILCLVLVVFGIFCTKTGEHKQTALAPRYTDATKHIAEEIKEHEEVKN